MDCSNKNCKYWRKATAGHTIKKKFRFSLSECCINYNTYGGCKFGYCKMRNEK